MPKPTRSKKPGTEAHGAEDGRAGKNSEEMQKELQKKYVQLQIMKQYAEALAQEKKQAEAKLTEMAISINAIEKLQETKKGQEVLTNLGSDAYVQADLSDVKNILVGIGAGVFVKKPVAEALETLNDRKGQLEKVNAEMEMQLTALVEMVQKLEPEVQHLAQQL